MSAKVYLVGSGPGDPALLTLKAKDLLGKADAIIYDALVSGAIRNLCKRTAEMIFVGKRAGAHSHKQEEINRIIIETARRIGGIIVRLKGGDPFVFGRGGEEMIALKEAGIAYEIVPGVTSGIAAPAYFGIPVTHRAVSRSVHLITASTKDGTLPDLDWDMLSHTDGTLVFYMGMHAIPEITAMLTQHGFNPQTPAAVISQGTTANQKILTDRLCCFTRDYIDYAAYSPGLFVVGEVVSFAKDYGWMEDKPLKGQKIVVTRSLDQSSSLSEKLEQAGAEVEVLPTIDILPVADQSELDNEIRRINEYDWLIFTSVNAVDIFFDRLFAQNLDVRSLSGCHIAVVGPATTERLKNFGLQPDFMPEKHTGLDLANELSMAYPEMKGRSVLIPASAIAHTDLKKGLEKQGVHCKQLAVYENRPIAYEYEELRTLLEENCHWLTFCSSSAVRNFMSLIESYRLTPLLKNVRMGVIGSITAKTLKDYGFDFDAIPDKPTIDNLVNELIRITTNK